MDWSNLLTTERFSENGNRFSKNDTKKEYSFKKYNRGNFTCIDDDYQTIIRSASFRRLQDKTQVFPLLRVGRGDDAFFAADLVGVLVHLDAHELEAGGDGHALGSAVLADTCGEDDGVHAAHRGGIRTDELLHAVVEHIDGKAGALIALLEGLFEIAEVGADAADAHDAGLLVEDIDHLLDVHAVLVHQVLHDTGVQMQKKSYLIIRFYI